VFDWTICTSRMVLLFAFALGGYAMVCYLLRRAAPDRGYFYAALIVAAVLGAYWLLGHHPVHAERRYYMRTLLIVFTPIAGIAASIMALRAQNLLRRNLPYLLRVSDALRGPAAARAILGAVAIVTLVHAVETQRFVATWTDYRHALRALAGGTASDPTLGDARFVSSGRIDHGLNRLSWWSTTPYLSVLVTSNLAPARLVFAPDSNYFWLSCETATANARAQNPVPQDTRRLIAKYSCLHRR
jgi:hypothetical protein